MSGSSTPQGLADHDHDPLASQSVNLVFPRAAMSILSSTVCADDGMPCATRTPLGNQNPHVASYGISMLPEELGLLMLGLHLGLPIQANALWWNYMT